MYRNFVIITSLLVMSLLCMSCAKDEYEVHETPFINLSVFVLNPVYDSQHVVVGGEDTLGLVYDEALKVYVLDTIAVGDTVVLAAEFNARSNNLTAVGMSVDSTALCAKFLLTDAIRSAIKQDSVGLSITFDTGYRAVGFPIEYVSLQSGVHTLSFMVASDSKYSPTSVSIQQPVRE